MTWPLLRVSSLLFLIEFSKLFLASEIGVLMEEAGEAVEFFMFGFKIQHYGPEESKYIVIYSTLDNDEYKLVWYLD
jgi:hypothetical protein